MWRKLLKGVLGCFLLLVLALVVTGLLKTAYVAEQPQSEEVAIYVVSNGVHISLALPVQQGGYDWTVLFSPDNSQQPALAASQDYVLIGWGSRTFYTQVPTWSALTASLAVKALAFDSAAFNVAYIPEPVVGDSVRVLRLSRGQYQQLVTAIVAEVPVDVGVGAKPLMIQGVHYGSTDVFYEAKGRYTPWFTCNEWIRQRLFQADVAVPLWSPFAAPIMWHLDSNVE